MCDADADPADVGGDVEHAIGHCLALFLVGEVVRVDALRLALAPDPAFWQRCGVEVLQVATDRRARDPGDLKDRVQPAPSRRPRLPGRKHPPPALIELRADRLPAFANRLRVDHADPLTAEATPEEARPPESHHRMAQGRKIDSVVLAAVLSWLASPHQQVDWRSTAAATVRLLTGLLKHAATRPALL